MECCLRCFMSEDDINSRIKNREIEMQLTSSKNELRRLIKVLLLGSGESGKSTFLKQMKIINDKGFSPEELQSFKLIIYSNIVMGMKVLIDAVCKLNLNYSKNTSHGYAEMIFKFQNNIRLEEPVFMQYVFPISELWKDEGIQIAYYRRREFLLGDAIKYFMEHLSRIGLSNYVPTNLDILYARKATKGVSEHNFIINKVPFRFVDVGGQRSQRQWWFNCFQDVKSILFLVSSSEFDQVIVEDRKTNRLVESCAIFDAIANNNTFSEVSIMLFLNKTDLLTEKIKEVSISKYFPSFEGDMHDLKQVQKFILEMFLNQRRDINRKIYPHYTTAVDTENIRHVFRDVRDTILARNLNNLMLQ